MQTIQRARGAESRVRYRSANGPLRVQSNAFIAKYSATYGTRQLPWVYSYLKAHELFVNQGGTADNSFIRP